MSSESYANITKHNLPPAELQAHADPALLTTEQPLSENASSADENAKVHVVPHDYKETIAQSEPAKREILLDDFEDELKDSSSGKKAKKQAKRAKEKTRPLLDTAQNLILRPEVAGGLIGIVNIGIFATVGRAFWTRPDLRTDGRALGSAAAALITLFTVEGIAAERYSRTERGQEEAKRVKEEGSLLYRQAREHVLRPGVLGGLVGLANTAIIGAIGYTAYTHWDKPRWDRRTVSVISVGLLTLWGVEGYAAEQYRVKHK